MSDGLTPRQQEIAALVADGLTNGEIAVRLAIAEGTVARHIYQTRRALGLRNRVQLAVWAVLHGLYPRRDRARPSGDPRAGLR